MDQYSLFKEEREVENAYTAVGNMGREREGYVKMEKEKETHIMAICAWNTSIKYNVKRW